MEKWKGAQKAAMLLLTLGEEASSMILRNLSKEEIKRVSMHMAEIHRVEKDASEEVLQEFMSGFKEDGRVSMPGGHFLRNLLPAVLGNDEASDLMAGIESEREKVPVKYIKDIDSDRAERLTFLGRYNTQPSWSPKGDKIAYSAIKNGRSNIWVIGIDGDDPVQLTQNEGDNESPAWSPDGSLIVFSSTREGPSRIYVMTAYGTDQRRLLTLPGEQTDPEWSPRVINK